MRVNIHNPVALSLPASTTKSQKTYGVRADILIPGRGDPIKNGTLVIEDEIIAWVGEYTTLPTKYSSLPFTKVKGALMPGMWDVHTHFFGVGPLGGMATIEGKILLPGTEVQIGALTTDDLRATLMAGFTSVRECGGYAGYMQPLIDAGLVVGPTVYSSLSILSITGGHGDMHDSPLSTIQAASVDGKGLFALCDGVDECIKRTRQTIRKGAKLIKICSTGGVLSLDDQPEDAQFSPAELEAIVQEAARSGRIVAAHAIGKPGIINALKAGVKSIEHGMYLDNEVADLIKEKNAILVPTRHIVETLAKDRSGLDDRQKVKIERMLQLSRSSVKLAVEEGVRQALGTDTLYSDRSHPLSHGKNAMELHWMKVAGMTALQAIEAATANAVETLGPQAPKAGQLKAGYDADFIAVKENPLDDVDVLVDVDNVSHVWKGGKLFKSPIA